MMPAMLWALFCLLCFTAPTLNNDIVSMQVNKTWSHRDQTENSGVTAIAYRYQIKDKVVRTSVSNRKNHFWQVGSTLYQLGSQKQHLQAQKQQRINVSCLSRDCSPSLYTIMKNHRRYEIICTAQSVGQSAKLAWHVSLGMITKLFSGMISYYETMIVHTQQYKPWLCSTEDKSKFVSSGRNACFPCCADVHNKIACILDRFQLTNNLSQDDILCLRYDCHQPLEQQRQTSCQITVLVVNGSHCEYLFGPGFYDKDNADSNKGQKDRLLYSNSHYSNSHHCLSCGLLVFVKYKIILIWQNTEQIYTSGRVKTSDGKDNSDNWRRRVSSELHLSKLILVEMNCSDITSYIRTDCRTDIVHNIEHQIKVAGNYWFQKVAEVKNLRSWNTIVSRKPSVVQSTKKVQNRRQKIMAVNVSYSKNDNSNQKKQWSKTGMLHLLRQPQAKRDINNDKNSRLRRNIDNTSPVDIIPVNMAILLPMTQDRLFCKERVFAAIQIAMETVKKVSLAPTALLQASFADSYCSISDAMNAAIEFYARRTVTVFLGPVCDFAVAPIARQIRYWQLPMITPGAMAADFGFRKTSMFPLLTRVGSNFNALLELWAALFKHYKWYKMKVIYMPNGLENIMDKFCHIAAEAIVLGNRMNKLNLTLDYKSFHDVQLILDELVAEIGTHWGVSAPASTSAHTSAILNPHLFDIIEEDCIAGEA